MAKEIYIDLMERVLSAYSVEHIHRYFRDVKTNGLTEHGFPRLTVDIGILIAHGRRQDLLPVFLEMMEFCCRTIPHVKAANDFSVREIICCLWEMENSGLLPRETTERWWAYLREIEPTSCYTRFAVKVTDKVRNWALFTAVSEFYRQKAGLCDSADFIDLQLEQQLQWFDENGMYRDDPGSEIHQPVVYDLVPRGLMTLLLSQGYRGRHYERIDAILKKSALLTLKMQSPTGEVPFGGRSNQFVHNEGWLDIIFEYEAIRYEKECDRVLAGRYKAAAERAIDSTKQWLVKEPIRHVKNRFPTETNYGCEGYAYFDKYMITAASLLYAAYSIADDSVASSGEKDVAPCAFETSRHFHKLFLKAGGYGIELDLDADPHYDATGLGRLQRAGAPSVICLSCPCPAEPTYELNRAQPVAFSACAAAWRGDGWELAAERKEKIQVLASGEKEDCAFADVKVAFAGQNDMTERYTVSKAGVQIVLKGKGKIGYALPALSFDGEVETVICCKERELTVCYDGWVCRYRTDGDITEIEGTACNRNGHYRRFVAVGEDEVSVEVQIEKEGNLRALA